MGWLISPLRYGIILTILFVVSCAPAANEPVPATRPVGEGDTGLTTTPEATASPEPYPPPTWTLPPVTPVPEPTEPPTPTNIPFPTVAPTPEVTPIPTVAPPVIPEAVGKTQQPFWIYYWEGNEVWRADSEGQDREMLLDTYASLGQWLTGHPREGTDCCWDGRRVVASPDGQKLALVVVDKIELTSPDEPFTFSIYVLNVRTDQLSLISQGVQPQWSPDGQQIAFLREEFGGLWIANIQTGGIREVVAKHENPLMNIEEYTWAPDSIRIAYYYTYGAFDYVPKLWLVDTVSQTPPELILEQQIPIFGIQWSLDGQDVLFVSQEGNEDVAEEFKVRNLWSLSVETGVKTQLTTQMWVDIFTLSPDYPWILIRGFRLFEQGEGAKERDLWLLRQDGQELKRATANLGSVRDANWTPDGTRLFVLRTEAHSLLLSLEEGEVVSLDFDLGLDFLIGGLK